MTKYYPSVQYMHVIRESWKTGVHKTKQKTKNNGNRKHLSGEKAIKEKDKQVGNSLQKDQVSSPPSTSK